MYTYIYIFPLYRICYIVSYFFSKDFANDVLNFFTGKVHLHSVIIQKWFRLLLLIL